MESNGKNEFLSTRLKLNELIRKYNSDYNMDDFEITQHVQTMNEQIYTNLTNHDIDVNDNNRSGNRMLLIITAMNKQFIEILTEINTDNDNSRMMDSIINEMDIIKEIEISNSSLSSRICSKLINIADICLDSKVSHIFNMDDNKIDMKDNEIITGDSICKMIKTIFIILFTLIVFYFNISGYITIAWLMALYFIKFFIIFIYLYSTTTNMHALNIITCKIAGFGHISFPFQIDYHPSFCITSISQLAAFRGSSVYIALYDMLTVNGICLFCSIAFKWYEYNNNDNNDWSWNNYQHLSLIFGLTTIFGMISIGIWELNHHSTIHKIMHYFGVIALLTVGIAILFQLNFSIFSIFLFSINLISWCIYYIVSTFYYDTHYKDNSKKVHIASIVSITLQVIAWIILAFIITFFVYNLHQQ